MIRPFSGCGKFQRLVAERDDRVLDCREQNFIERHRLVCSPCHQSEKQFAAALNMLRNSTLEPESPPQFEERIIRRWRINRSRDRFEYWSPAFAGAAVACVAIFAAMQMISRSSELPQLSVPKGEAMRVLPQNDFPTLLLDRHRDSAPRR